jgi:hypothetical protein
MAMAVTEISIASATSPDGLLTPVFTGNTGQMYGLLDANNRAARHPIGQSGTSGGLTYAMSQLINIVDTMSANLQTKIGEIQTAGDQISISDMFDMQMDMNHLQQMSEMSTSIVSATNQSIMSMARGVKG